MNEIISFLVPQDVFIQLLFFCIISFLTLFTCAFVFFSARESNWNNRWQRSVSKFSLKHLELESISETVITNGEKLAEIMPGILLVVGLLGTFINLGIALDDASILLSSAHVMSQGSAANTFKDLLGLMGGLGAKFKTSSWGILGFLVVQAWTFFFNFNSKRHEWAIRKLNELTDKKRDIKAKELIEIKDSTTKAIRQFIQDHKISLLHDNNINSKSSLEALSKLGFFLERIDDHFISGSNQSIKALEEMNGNIKNLSNTFYDSISGLDQSAAKIKESAVILSESSLALKTTVSVMDANLNKLLLNIAGRLSDSINDLSRNTSSVLSDAKASLENSSQNISNTLVKLNNQLLSMVEKLQSSIENGAKMQANGISSLQTSSDSLSENMLEMKELIEKMSRSITAGLQSVSDYGQRMESIGNGIRNMHSFASTQDALLSEVQSIRSSLSNSVAVRLRTKEK